jgi:hypothetical protein
MVSTIERIVCYSGLIGIYSYSIYKYFFTRNVYDLRFHKSVISQGTRFVKEINKSDNNLHFVETSNQKLLFLLGVDNSEKCLMKSNMDIVDKLIENFTPNYIVYEKDIQ